MPTPRDSPPYYVSTRYRLVTGGFGVLLIGVGVYVAAFSPSSLFVRCVAGAAFALFGGNAVHAAFSARESWLSRLGPLP